MNIKQLIINIIKEIISWAKPTNYKTPEYFDTVKETEREVEEFYREEVLLRSDIDAENDIYPQD